MKLVARIPINNNNQQQQQQKSHHSNVLLPGSHTATRFMDFAQFFDIPIIFGMVLIQLISIAVVFNAEEYSPLLLFSWWRNKIS
ncbi:hypothetical protein DMENIID0001_127240 [Sergentomyia squamirostris]